jgi:hypothetical protein
VFAHPENLLMQVFTIAPAGMKPLWVLLPVALVLLLVVSVLALSVWGSRGARFELSAGGLQLRGDLYGRFIPAASLRTDVARRVDLDAQPDLRPRWRTMGTGLPGYQSGWFRLANGESALLYLTDRRKAVHVPTTLGYSLLISPDDPDAFVSVLRTLGSR